MKPHHALTAALGLVLALDGALAGAATAAPASKGNPCRMLTSSEVSTLLAGPVTKTLVTRSPGVPRQGIAAFALCRYLTANPSDTIQIIVTSIADPSKFTPDKNALDAGAKQVSGIGDDAFVIDGMGMISVRRGTDTVTAVVSRRRDAARVSHQQLLALGRNAAKRF